ncbi:MAG: response regulator transcription factor [Spirochaetaceae bacterium]|jgi:two-component system alkaline phosphatase synthesis response regulator PhoP|nr:response regulator transcription factor [Spirochaetaceae bacterium]
MICLVEDEKAIRDLILYTLKNAGLEARGFEDGKTFWRTINNTDTNNHNNTDTKKDPDNGPALVILDLMLPGEDGLSILKRLRSSKRFARVPVIILTAKGAEYDTVLGLESGADDYLVKPVGMMELVARAKVQLRRTAPEPDETLTLGELCVNIPAHRVTVGQTEVFLTLKEFDLLAHLLKYENIVFSREQLLKEVWGFSYAGETRTVDTHILTLRGKLLSAGSLIKTVRGLGYKIGEP